MPENVTETISCILERRESNVYMHSHVSVLAHSHGLESLGLLEEDCFILVRPTNRSRAYPAAGPYMSTCIIRKVVCKLLSVITHEA